MTEKLLQFIWQNRLFNSRELHLHSGEPVSILKTGSWNHHQGPDFSNGLVRIGNTLWAGHIELHLLCSDWYRHAHAGDPHYGNVVLHVVWENDLSAPPPIPLLILRDRIPHFLLDRYEEWMSRNQFIPCASQLSQVDSLAWLHWKERLLMERLERKMEKIRVCLQENGQHWEETCWWLLARNFGLPVNADSFEQIARSLPVVLLARQKSVLVNLEALLLGQAGLLEKEFSDAYPRLLQREYRFMQKKYGLQPLQQPLCFLRMRPENFPGLRLAQLASLIQKSTHLFSCIRSAGSWRELQQLFDVTANDFWHYHYVLDESSAFKPKRLGKTMQQNLLINTAIPLLFAYGYLQGDRNLTQKALDWLSEMPSESNHIIDGFSSIGISSASAADSQSLKELKTSYCEAKRCLECGAGYALLRNTIA